MDIDIEDLDSTYEMSYVSSRRLIMGLNLEARFLKPLCISRATLIQPSQILLGARMWK